jgi:hypothetical protein
VDRIVPVSANVSERDRLTDGALRWLILHLRCQPPDNFLDVSVEEFGVYVQAAVWRMLGPVRTPVGPSPSPPQPVPPEDPTWEICHWLAPVDAVGGDWIDFDRNEDGAVWLLVADVTHHGLSAYLLASALPALWRFCRVAEARTVPAQPQEVLARMHAELYSIPGLRLYVEATVGRFARDGTVELAFAGAGLAWHRQSSACVRHQPGGPQLRFPFDCPEFGSCCLRVQPGEEVAVTSDGVADQSARWARWLWWLPGTRGILRLLTSPAFRRRVQVGHLVRGWEKCSLRENSLYQAFRSLLRRVLRVHKQDDDMSLVSFRYRR